MPRKDDQKPPKPAPATRPTLALALLLLCLATRAVVIGQTLDFQGGGFFRGPLTDDTFYSLNLARNLAAGAGFTFDRLHETNGFQPLYVFLMVPVYAALPYDPVTPIKIAMVLLGLANTAAAFFLWRILRREVSERAALFGLGLFSLSPYIIDQGMNGLETSLALLLFLAAYDLYLARVRPGKDSRRDRLVLSLLLALLVFARIDGAILAAAIAADYLLRRDPVPFRRRLFKMAEVTAVALALYCPWLIWNQVHFGTALPQSGAAVRIMAQLYGGMELPVPVPVFVPGDIPAVFYLGHVISALMLLGIAGLFFPAGPAIFLLMLAGQAGGIWWTGHWAVGVPLLLAAGVPAFRARRSLGAAWWAVGLTIAAYSFYTFGAWFFHRYLYAAEVCLLILGMALLEKWWARSRQWAWVAAAGFAVLLAYNWAYHRESNDIQLFNYDMIKQALDQKTPVGSRAGTFQTGYVGYFSPGREVVNLDGVVNPKAHAALRDGRLYAYLREEGIEYVADFKNLTDRLLLPRLGADPRLALEPLTGPDDPVQVFRVKK